MEDGIQFYISSNNVILTEGFEGTLAPVYFKRVTKKDGTLVQTSPVQNEKELEEKPELNENNKPPKE